VITRSWQDVPCPCGRGNLLRKRFVTHCPKAAGQVISALALAFSRKTGLDHDLNYAATERPSFLAMCSRRFGRSSSPIR
jgi:hypothetical protein